MVASANAVPGDLVPELPLPHINTRTCIIRNGTGSSITLDNFVGVPLKAGTNGADYNIALGGADEANVVALLMNGPPGLNSEVIPATTNSPTKWRVLEKPPATINQNKIRTNDPTAAGTAYVTATIVTALKALGFAVRSEPTKSTTL